MKIPISPDIKLDVMRLVETRCLLQASSGGGKSMTLRTILESTFGMVPHIILDTEGEFSSLREKYDYILAGEEGDIPADPRTAQLLARKSLEMNLSIIIDLYELSHREKHSFVRLFLDALVKAPKNLWGPRLLVIDEAHEFCPEKGQGSSEAWETVIDVCAKGRKRGLGAILATQRPAKLNKDATAECQNKIIGLANISIDRKRAAEELGFTSKEEILTLRDMEPGEFYCIGPALCKDVVKTQINEAKTSHPKIGKRVIKAPVATKKVLKLLEGLKDLPKVAQQELKTEAELRTKISQLESQLRQVPKPVVVTEKVNTEKLRRDIAIAYRLSANMWRDGILKKVRSISDSVPEWVPPEVKLEIPVSTPGKGFEINKHAPLMPLLINRPLPKASEVFPTDKPIGYRQKQILHFLCSYKDEQFKLAQMALMIGSPNNGTFSNLCSDLATRGLINRENSKLSIRQVDEAHALIGKDFQPRNSDLAYLWKTKLKGRNLKIYEHLLETKQTFTLANLAEALGYPNNGTFSNLCSALSGQGVIIREKGTVRLNPDILTLP